MKLDIKIVSLFLFTKSFYLCYNTLVREVINMENHVIVTTGTVKSGVMLTLNGIMGQVTLM